MPGVNRPDHGPDNDRIDKGVFAETHICSFRDDSLIVDAVADAGKLLCEA
jgi:hypothetical protein